MNCKIIDCITFFDNNLMFDLRYNILKDYVAYFVICESKFDHKNKEKNIISLKRQYRMNEKICKLINKYFYDNTLITDESVKKSQKKYPK